MVAQLMPDIDLYILPKIAMLLFLAMFVVVVLRVCQRSRRSGYDHMASLPLENDSQSE